MCRNPFAVALLFAVVCAGCAEQPLAAPENGVAIAQVQDNPPVQEEVSNRVAAPQLEQTQGADTISNRVSDLVGKATSKAPTLEDAKKWISDTGQATGQTADATLKWVNETYKSLSDNGMTSAKSAKEWVAEDWKSINAWEYKVVSVNNVEALENPNVLEETLNTNGKLRWDCFHVSEDSNTTRFFMKRRRKSYLKNVPLKDMLKLIPLLDTGGQE